MIFDNKKLYNLRVTARKTQKELGSLVGVTHVTLRGWERGEITPTIEKINLLGKVFRIPGTDFIQEG